MQFKDLPSYEEVQSSYINIFTYVENDVMYPIHPIHIYHVYHVYHNEQVKYTTHRNLYDAYNFLKRNSKLEVLDNVFGNNFPFLHGEICICQKTAMVVITRTKVLDDAKHLILKHNFDYDECGNNDPQTMKDACSYISSMKKQGLHVFCDGNTYFAAPSYDKLVERIEVMKLMDI